MRLIPDASPVVCPVHPPTARERSRFDAPCDGGVTCVVITFPDRHHARLFDEPIPTPGSAAETASINARWEEMWINYDTSRPLVRVPPQTPATPALTPIAKK